MSDKQSAVLPSAGFYLLTAYAMEDDQVDFDVPLAIVGWNIRVEDDGWVIKEPIALGAGGNPRSVAVNLLGWAILQPNGVVVGERGFGLENTWSTIEEWKKEMEMAAEKRGDDQWTPKPSPC